MKKKAGLLVSGMIFVFCLLMFYFQLSTYSLLPAEEGGVGLGSAFRNLWSSSVWFYGVALSLLTSIGIGFSILGVKNIIYQIAIYGLAIAMVVVNHTVENDQLTLTILTLLMGIIGMSWMIKTKKSNG